MAKEEKEDLLDEDLFGFDTADESITSAFEDEEDLDALFAAFHAQEEDAAETREPDNLDPFIAEEQSAPADLSGGHDEEPSGSQPADESTTEKRKSFFGRKAQGDHEHSGSAARVVLSSPLASKSSLLILISVTALNGLVAFVTLRGTATMRDSVLDAQRNIANAADEIREESLDNAIKLVRATTPIVPPDPDTHPTFDRARHHIEDGEYSMARQRIYALLSVVDRLEEEQRSAVESRAQYLLAEATHLEALARMGGGK